MKSNKKYWGIAGFLAVAIITTIGILAGVMNHTSADANTIALVAPSGDSAPVYTADEAKAMPTPVVEINDAQASASVRNNSEAITNNLIPSNIQQTEAAAAAVAHPGMKVEDENGIVWSYTVTPIEIFHKQYGGDYPITVLTSDEDKLIAPGTEDEYTFSLKNTGDVKLRYKLWTEAYISPDGLEIPIVAKMSDAKGGYLTGSKEDWSKFLSLHNLEDSGDLNVSSYANYSLSWMWPYESGEKVSEGLEDIYAGDAYDTWLGNRAVDEDLSVKVIIHVMACYDESVPAAPTGDDMLIWISGGAALLLLILALILLIVKKKKEQDKKEADKEGEEQIKKAEALECKEEEQKR